nr:sugar efflux transporter [Thaumasiovibrio subtropicus]
MTALAFAFVLPIMSLFLVEELNAQPMYIGLYTTTASLMTILISPKLTGLIDKGVSSKHVFLLTLAGIFFGALGFSAASEFWHALLIGMFVMPFASSSIPVVLTIIRGFADATGENSTQLNSQMRSSVSLLWIFGPPLAFVSVDKLGFTLNYFLAATIASLVFLFVAVMLKLPADAKASKSNVSKTVERLPKEVWYLAAVMFLANVANSTYLNAMPIYLTRELGLPKSYPGILLGLTAAIEIPIMLLAAKWSKKHGKGGLLKVGFASAMLFYIGMYSLHDFYLLLPLQLINGVFFGIFVGLGVTYMQDLAPKAIGKASAFYTNTMLVGTMVGTSLMGVISQGFGFKAPLILCLLAISLALIGLVWFDRYQKRQMNSPVAVSG